MREHSMYGVFVYIYPLVVNYDLNAGKYKVGPGSSYKWSYDPYKWPYKWVTGVLTPFTTGSRARLVKHIHSASTIVKAKYP